MDLEAVLVKYRLIIFAVLEGDAFLDRDSHCGDNCPSLQRPLQLQFQVPCSRQPIWQPGHFRGIHMCHHFIISERYYEMQNNVTIKKKRLLNMWV
jgi:hypothetical protein